MINFTILDWLKETSIPFFALICGAIILGIVLNYNYIMEYTFTIGVIGIILLAYGCYYMGAITQRLIILGVKEKESNV